MNKRLLTVIFAFVLLLGAVISWAAYSKLTKELPYGLAVDYSEQSEQQQEVLEKAFNDFLDREEVLKPIVEEINVSKLLKTENKDEQIQRLADKSRVYFHDNKTLHFVVTGSRLHQKTQMQVAKKLKEAWAEALKKQIEKYQETRR